MNNYEYIIASLPVLHSDERNAAVDVEGIIAEIRSQCSESDNRLIDTVLDGCKGDCLDAEFYTRALSSRNAFVRGYFAFDLSVRNAKVAFLNRALGRAAGTDVITLERDKPEFEREEETLAVLSRTDILERERGLDELMWEWIDELTAFDVFDINVILGFLAKLRIVGRWLNLDEGTGREMFRKLVDEIRKTNK